MGEAHGLVPFRLADSQDGFPAAVSECECGDIDLPGLLAGRVVHSAGLDPGREPSGDLLGSEVPGPVPAQLLKVRAEDVGGEAGLAPFPQPRGVTGVRQVGPDRAHHPVVEGDQRLGDHVAADLIHALNSNLRPPVL